MVDPENGPLHESLGDVLKETGDTNAAAGEYRRAAGLAPEDPSPRQEIAYLLLQQKQYDSAMAEAQAALQLRADQAGANYIAGQVMEHRGDRKSALTYYWASLKADPRNRMVRDAYSRVWDEARWLPMSWSASTVRAFTLSMALVPSFLLLGYFRTRDLYPEPARMLWGTFILGVLIVWPVIWIDRPLAGVVALFTGTFSNAMAEAFFNAAFPEELMKFAVLMLFCVRSKEFDEPMDGIVYGVVASLGFATYENIHYVARYGIGTAITRAINGICAAFKPYG